MPFDIHYAPACADTKDYTPAHNELVFVVSSTLNTEPNFKYIHRIKNATTGAVLATIRQFPDPDGYGVIDAHRIVESYVASEVEANDTGFRSCSGSTLAWKVSFGWEYGDPNVTEYFDMVNSDTYYAWDATVPHLDYIDFDSADYVANDVTTSPLTSEDAFRIRRGAGAWLHILQDSDKNVSVARVKTYNSAGVINGIFDIKNTSFSGATGNYNRLLRIPAGPRNLALVPTGSITTSFGATPIIDNEVYSYKVHFRTSAASGNLSWDFSSICNGSGDLDTPFPAASTTIDMGIYQGYDTAPPTNYTNLCELIGILNNALSDDMVTNLTCGSSDQINAANNAAYDDIIITVGATVYTFPMVGVVDDGVRSKEVTYNIVEDSCRYPQHHLVFRNYMGGFDSIQLTQAPHKSSKTKKEAFQRVTGSRTGNQWGYNAKDRGFTIYHSLSTKTVKGATHPLTDDEWVWIEQLIQSPEVYEEMELNGSWVLVPIIITTENYDNKYGNADGPQQLTIEYKYAHKQNPLR